MQLAARIGTMARSGKQLPYDAEVEYLQSVRSSIGTLIDTGVDVFDSTDFDITIRFRCDSFYDYVTMWSSSADKYESWVYKTGKMVFRINNLKSSYIPLQSGVDYNYHLSGRDNSSVTCEIDGIVVSEISRTWSKDAPLYLFGGYGNSAGAYRCYYVHLRKNGVLVRDYIPVRVGDVGYLYDSVSGKLFGSSGTGAFIIGPDKTA